jgi:hypothetical protein
MKNLKIITRIFTEHKSLSLMNKLYLSRIYISNLKRLKNNHNVYYHKYKLSEFNKPSEKKVNTGIDFKKELTDIKYSIRINRFRYIRDKLIWLFNKFNLKYLIDLKNSQNNVELFFEFLTRHIATYKQAIHELVEGQREVTQNRNFRFPDGETVGDKMDSFDKRVKEVLHITNKK